MKINQETLSEMKDKSAKTWARLVELHPEIKDKLNENTASDLWFRTWASVAYTDDNPNVIRDADGNRLFEYNHSFELYPCNADDTTMKAAYKRIYRHILENQS